MTITVAAAIARALRLCGQTGAPGRTASTEQLAEALTFLNQFLDGWNTLKNMIFRITDDRYTLTPSQESYTIGPSGGDFTAARPIRIEAANIVQTSVSPEVRIPLVIFDDDEWADVAVRSVAASIPTVLHYKKLAMGSVLGRLFLWPYPNVANDLELFTWSPLNSALASGDSIIVPEGYVDAIVYSLAERLAPLYHRKASALLQMVTDEARKARARVVSLNSQAPKQASDAPSGTRDYANRGPYYNYLTGLTR